MCGLRALDVVECIDDAPVLKQSAIMPEAGLLYRIQSVRRVCGGFSVRLFELTPECYLGGPCNCGNCGWDSGRFRLARRREEDRLSVLRALLNKMETPPGVVPEVVD